MTQPSHVQTSHPHRKLGRLAPHPEVTHLRLTLTRFLVPGLNVPPAVDYLSKVRSWPVALNDSLGDCTAAAAAHQRTAWTCYGQGAPVVTSDDDVLAFYEACSGYKPGRPDTDRGAVMQDCLDVWRKTGLAGDRIIAFFQLNHRDLTEVRTALWLFGGVYVGVDMPTSALDQFDAGQAWDYSQRADNRIRGGHCVHLGAMDPDGVMTVTTWGKTQKLTPLWWSHYTMECWAPVSQSWVRDNTSPEGLDVAALNHAFQALTHQPGPFRASPTPPAPVPPATAPVVSTADQALAEAIPASWLQGRHIGGNATVQAALQSWFDVTGLEPGKGKN